MLNHKHNVHKRTNSKILLIILCIFGLLFSWSCSCKNRVSDPNETPIDGGIKTNNTITNYIPRTYTATKSGDTLIIVNSDGNGIQQAAKISFQDAKVTSVTVDVGTTGIAADVFKYESGGLTMTAFDNVTESRQKVTATFSLAPNDSRDKLNNPTETVDIEVVKASATVQPPDAVANILKAHAADVAQIGNIFFMPQNSQNDKLTVQNISTSTEDADMISPDQFKDKVLERWFDNNSISKYFSKVEFSGYTPEDGNADALSFKFTFTYLPECGGGVKEYTIEATAKSSDNQKGKWTTQL